MDTSNPAFVFVTNKTRVLPIPHPEMTTSKAKTERNLNMLMGVTPYFLLISSRSRRGGCLEKIWDPEEIQSQLVR